MIHAVARDLDLDPQPFMVSATHSGFPQTPRFHRRSTQEGRKGREMSKIYEALRQAELDRANSPNSADQKPARAAPSLPAVLDPPRVRVTRRRRDRSRRDQCVAARRQRACQRAGCRSLPGLDLGNVQECNWTPSLHQLPALEERGSAVEQFRSLRSRMQEFRDLNTLKSILVSSGLPQEGQELRRRESGDLLGAPQGRRGCC